MAATRLADIGARDTQPLVLGRRGQHFLQQLAVLGLQLAPLLERGTGLADAFGKRVAHPLKLVEPRDTGLAVSGRDAGVQGKPGEGLSAKPRELVLEATDLAAQLGAGEALVASHSKRRKRFSIE